MDAEIFEKSDVPPKTKNNTDMEPMANSLEGGVDVVNATSQNIKGVADKEINSQKHAQAAGRYVINNSYLNVTSDGPQSLPVSDDRE